MTPSRLNTLSLAGWAALVWGLPFSHAAMSIGTAWLGVLAVVGLCTSAEARRRLTSASSWRPLLCLAALLGWSTLSMVWTSDASWGWRVLGLQWPILVLMLAWPALGMDDRDHAKVHGWVLGSAGLAMAVCLGWGAWQLSQGEVLEGRDWSPWVSHVRLSLFAALGLGWAATSRPMWQLALFSLVWGAFVGVTGSLTSAVLLPLSWAWIGLQRVPDTWQRRYRGGVLALAAVAAAAAVWVLQPTPLPAQPWLTTTSWGNPYQHRPERLTSENGHRLHMHVCRAEWDQAWDQISDVPLSTLSQAGFPLSARLWRYLTSKGWPKDGAHILQLTPAEVQRIEAGATSVVERRGFEARLAAFRWEWETWLEGGNPSGHSVFQRLEHWAAGWHALGQALWVGHGAGDAEAALQAGYDATGTKLASQHRHRAHNQHLTWGVTGGLVAILLWLAFLGTHMWTARTVKGALWGGLVVALSCVFEDTLETQAGAMVAGLAWALASSVQANNPKAASETS